MTRWHWLALVATALVAVTAAQQGWKIRRAAQDLTARVGATQEGRPQDMRPCMGDGAAPLVLLALGQSNAGNHGAEDEAPGDGGPPRMKVLVGASCQVAGDPLPGATGRHRSIWARLPTQLQRLGEARPVVLALLAVGSTSVLDWTQPGSPLRDRLEERLRDLKAAGLQPQAVLWQQGEADARDRTSTDDYVAAFERLRLQLRGGGIGAPIIVALSTRCRGADGAAVRLALRQLAATHDDVRLGPDTDQLAGLHRHHDCHFSRAGLDAAAALWAASIAEHLR